VADRGGDLFILPKGGLSAGQSGVILRGTGSPVPDVALVDIMAHSLGVTPLHVAESAPFFSSEPPLRRRKLGVLLVVDGVGQGVSFPVLHALHSDVSLSSVVETSAFQDNHALLASVITGTPVREHGVVGEYYFSRDHRRHTDASRRTPSLSERVGAGSVFVGSGNVAMTELIAPSARTNVVALSWSGRLRHFISHVAGAPVVVDLHLPACVNHLELEWHGENALLEKSSFSLSNFDDVLFLAELELLLSESSTFRVEGDAPAFFGFVMSGMKGFSGEKLASAQRAVDRAFAASLVLLEVRVGVENVSWQVVLLDQQKVMLQAVEAVQTAKSELEVLFLPFLFFFF
jgi:hypothetical protein